MAPVDLVLVVVLLGSVALGFWRGLVYEVLSVLGWVAAFFLAQWYADVAAAWLPLAGASQPLRYAAGYVVVFVVVAFGAGLVAWLVKRLIETVGLRPVDRTLGAAFGLLRGAILLLALALVVGMTPLKSNEAWLASVGAGWLGAGLHVLKGAMPDHLAVYFP